MILFKLIFRIIKWIIRIVVFLLLILYPILVLHVNPFTFYWEKVLLVWNALVGIHYKIIFSNLLEVIKGWFGWKI